MKISKIKLANVVIKYHSVQCSYVTLIVIQNGVIFFEFNRTYFEASDEAEIEKKCALIEEATALAKTVLPLPGGPKNNIPNLAIVSC